MEKPLMELPPIKPLYYHGKRWTPLSIDVHGDQCVFKPLPRYTSLNRLVGWIGYAILALAAFVFLNTFDLSMSAFIFMIGILFAWVSRWARKIDVPSFDLKSGLAEIPIGIFGTKLQRIAVNEIKSVQYTPFQKHGTEPFKIIHAEISLLMRDGQRLNLVHHNQLARMREDGQKLADLLGVPLHIHGIWRL